jgi:hypothetical protein
MPQAVEALPLFPDRAGAGLAVPAAGTFEEGAVSFEPFVDKLPAAKEAGDDGMLSYANLLLAHGEEQVRARLLKQIEETK